ncbi:RNA polymerase sigma factor [Pyxidicoccus xibeiensis]|uniref:RNA polymerase sigma factor n=1 Tax=Pyxidicoccus xibeiensis TaxID=2906759 RepID=UPI0020A6EDE0|nr:RNA polymerase sigma factor [Pyxidicoccus xibeiensis]MCP3138592.1 RNA polymerase sigma factor [Pyxidicoccus xibeiensis]
MSKPRKEQLSGLGEDVKTSWHRFLDVFEPMRPELYRYCRYLTRSPWAAEDLAQDTLARAFVTLGTLFHEVPNPRGWLFRIASNLWIDRSRRARHEAVLEVEPPAEPATQADPREPREAAGTLLVRLSPQERAAVVLKDVFGLSLEEIADALSTTVGAVKAALHRGRGRLAAPEEPMDRAPAPGALDAFCEAFNARDLERLTALLLDNAVVEIVGVVTEYGKDAPADPRTGSFAGTIAPITHDERGGVPPELLEGYLATSPRCTVHPYRDTHLLLFWYEHVDGPKVRTVMTVDAEGDRILRVRNYFFTPDVIREVCEELQVPYRVNGYRYWPVQH